MFENSKITIFHFGTATVPKPPPTKKKSDYLRSIKSVWFPSLADWHGSIPHFTLLNLALSEFSQISGACNMWSPVLVHPSFSLCSSASLKIFFFLWHLFHHPPLKSLNRITWNGDLLNINPVIIDILLFLPKVSIFSQRWECLRVIFEKHLIYTWTHLKPLAFSPRCSSTSFHSLDFIP